MISDSHGALYLDKAMLISFKTSPEFRRSLTTSPISKHKHPIDWEIYGKFMIFHKIFMDILWACSKSTSTSHKILMNSGSFCTFCSSSCILSSLVSSLFSSLRVSWQRPVQSPRTSAAKLCSGGPVT